MRRSVFIGVVAIAVGVVVAAVGSAAKTGPGSSVGSASVFVPNPVQSLGIESLTDQKDSDAAVPAAAYHSVKLTNLDGSGFLRGDYANVFSSTGNLAFSPTNTFAYTRHQDEFEQVMAYYWMTEAQKYIHSLGFGVTRRPVNNGRRTRESTSGGWTTRSRPTIRRTSSASVRAGSTTPRTPR